MDRRALSLLIVATLLSGSVPSPALAQMTAGAAVAGRAVSPSALVGGLGGAPGSFGSFRSEFFDRMIEFRPELRASLGLPAGPRMLSDLSAPAVARYVEFLDDSSRRLAALAPEAARLGPQARIDHAVLQTAVRSQLHGLQEEQSHLSDAGAGQAPYDLIQFRMAQARQGPEGLQDWEEIARTAEEAPDFLSGVRSTLAEGASAGRGSYRGFVEREGIANGEEAARFFSEELAAKAREGLGEEAYASLAPRLELAARDAAEAYRSHAAFLAAEVLPRAHGDYALGETEYAWRLANELGVRKSPAELEKVGLDLARRIRGRMEELAQRIAPGKPLGELMAEINADHPADDAEMLRIYRETADRAREFVTSHGLFALPPGYRIDIVPAPAGMRSHLASAAYFPAPPYARGKKGVFLVVPADGDHQKLQIHNRSRIPTTVVHEAFPGHDMQFHEFQKSRDISPVRYLLDLAGYASAMNVEGYAHYAEELMRERGFYNPKEELAQLGSQLWRAYRIYLDAALHAGRVTLEEAARILREEAFRPAPMAKTEAYRYAKMPTQALTYLLGRLEIEQLKSDYKEAAGPAYREAEFHRLFLSFGPVPVALMRAAVLDAARAARRAAGGPFAWVRRAASAAVAFILPGRGF